jgi:hypothetical protein
MSSKTETKKSSIQCGAGTVNIVRDITYTSLRQESYSPSGIAIALAIIAAPFTAFTSVAALAMFEVMRAITFDGDTDPDSRAKSFGPSDQEIADMAAMTFNSGAGKTGRLTHEHTNDQYQVKIDTVVGWTLEVAS